MVAALAAKVLRSSQVHQGARAAHPTLGLQAEPLRPVDLAAGMKHLLKAGAPEGLKPRTEDGSPWRSLLAALAQQARTWPTCAGVEDVRLLLNALHALGVHKDLKMPEVDGLLLALTPHVTESACAHSCYSKYVRT